MDILLGSPIARWQLIADNFVTTALSLLAILAFLGFFTWIPALFGRYFLDALGTLNEGLESPTPSGLLPPLRFGYKGRRRVGELRRNDDLRPVLVVPPPTLSFSRREIYTKDTKIRSNLACWRGNVEATTVRGATPPMMVVPARGCFRPVGTAPSSAVKLTSWQAELPTSY
jgi:hypothetical protein